MKDFGRWVREQRLEKGLTQPQLAETTGLSVKTIFRAERGDAVRRLYPGAAHRLPGRLWPGEHRPNRPNRALCTVHIPGGFMMLY